MPYRADVIFSDSRASEYAWGIGFHWYEDWSGGKPMFDNVRNVHDNYPDKYIIFTEGTVESFVPDHFDYWPNGEEYAISMIHDFNNGTSAWTDWNILLDERGGPIMWVISASLLCTAIRDPVNYSSLRRTITLDISLNSSNAEPEGSVLHHHEAPFWPPHLKTLTVVTSLLF